MGPFEDPEIFLTSGEETLSLVVDLLDLEPDHRLLDLGCGCGRVALPFQRFASEEGSYFGLDVDRACIEWCVSHLQAKDARFHFDRLDVRSESYNPAGHVDPDRVILPYPNRFFDRALASSLFTHMREAGIDVYLGELARTLRSDGRLLISAFLMDDAAVAGVKTGTTDFRFVDRLGENSWTLDRDNPLDGVSLDERWIMSIAEKHGLKPYAIRKGTWRSTKGWAVEQDWIALEHISTPL